MKRTALARFSPSKTRRRTRRRGNPVPVLFANPRRRRRRGKRRGGHKRKRARRRSRGVFSRIGGMFRRKRRRRNPSQGFALMPHRRRRRRGRGGFRAFRGMRRHGRRRRNPMLRFGQLTSILRIALFGGLGIAAANIGRYFYTKYAAPKVLGAAPSGTRTFINDVLAVGSMGAMTWIVGKGLAHVPGVSGEDRRNFAVAGYAAMGWKGLGAVVKKLRPSADLAAWGMAGLGNTPFPYGAPYMQGRGMMGDQLEDVDSFAGQGGGMGYSALDEMRGMGDQLEDVDSFAGGLGGHGNPVFARG